MHLSPLKIAFLLLLAAIVLWVVGFSQTGECPVVYRTETVRGVSLSGLIENNDQVKIATGYYACHSAQRDDLVIYRDAGNTNPLIKIAKGVAGDTFAVALAEGGAKIFINGEALKTTAGIVYRLSPASYKLLSRYEQDYHGVIPAESLLILGNLPGGSRDSSQFGLVSQKSLIGKVVGR